MNEELKEKLINIKYNDIEQFNLIGLKTIGKIVDLYDGDTCRIILVFHNMLYKFNCRIAGLDTPEMKPLLTKLNRDIEIINAHKCRNKLLNLTTNCVCADDIIMKKNECKKLLENNTKLINIECFEFDKYGRLLVKIFNDEKSNKSINDILIEEGFAKKYDGGKKDTFTY